MKPIVEYQDYHLLVKEFYEERKRTSYFSWREFAKVAGFSSPTYLRLVSEGKSNLSRVTMDRMVNAMGLAGYEVDYFKAIIHKFGYEMADSVIADLAAFFKRQCREQKGFLARTGENQFSIIMESNELSEIESFCQKLIRECERDGMQANMNTWKVSFSIHYADISNISSSNISKIFNEAQKNCYKPETPAPKE